MTLNQTKRQKKKKKKINTSKRVLLCKCAINCGLIQDFQTVKRIQIFQKKKKKEFKGEIGDEAKKFMKGLSMMVVVLAIVVQVMGQAENPSFSHLSLNE